MKQQDTAQRSVSSDVPVQTKSARSDRKIQQNTKYTN